MNERDRSGRTALSHACEKDRRNVVSYLLKKYKDGGIAEMLNKHKDDGIIESLDRQDQTALVWAHKAGRVAILRLLIDNGADFRCEDRNKRKPLSHAAENGLRNVVRLLLQEEPQDMIPETINFKDNAGRTALSWAAEEGKLGVVQVLLDWGADVLLRDEKNRTPQMLASDKGLTRIANILDVHQAKIPGRTQIL